MLDEQIKNWLSEQGFPLEMQTASIFRKAGFEVRQSNIYSDPETGKSREIDILAINPDVMGVTQIVFVVECKSSKKPWLLMSDPQVLSGYHRVRAFAAVNQNAVEAMVDDSVLYPLIEKCPWFSKDGLTGYSLRTAFSEKDIAYEAASSAANAAFAYVKRAKNYQQRIAFPVIVIESPLIRCSLADDGEIQTEELLEGEVFFQHDDNQACCIRVVTLAGLAKFVQQGLEVASILREHLFNAEVKLWEDQFHSSYPRTALKIVRGEASQDSTKQC